MGGIEAGKAFIKFLLEDKEFKKGLSGAATSLKKFGAIGAAAAAPIVGAFTGAVASFVSTGDELQKMALRTGLSVESLSELKYAASQSGTSIAVFENAIKKMQVGLFDASRGTGSLFEATSALGIEYDSIKNLKPEDQFAVLSGAISKVEDPTLKAALAQKIFGRAGTQLLPLLSEGADGLDYLRNRAGELGLTMSTETANSAALLGDRLDDAKRQMIQLGIEIGAAVAGPLTAFVEGTGKLLAGLITWIRENPRMVRAIGAVAVGITAASTAAIALGTVLAIISAHPIIAALTAIAALVIAIATYFGFASDGADEFAGKLAEVKAESGISAGDSSSRTAQAQAVQQQLQAAVSQTVAPAAANHAAGLESAFVRKALEDLARYGEETAKGVKELVRLAQTGEAGFLSAGVG